MDVSQDEKKCKLGLTDNRKLDTIPPMRLYEICFENKTYVNVNEQRLYQLRFELL